MKIKDFIKNNENTPVCISDLASTEPYECLSKTIFEGMLFDIPQEYRECEVLKEGFLLGTKMNQLSIFLED